MKWERTAYSAYAFVDDDGEIHATLLGHYGGTYKYGKREFIDLESAQRAVEAEFSEKATSDEQRFRMAQEDAALLRRQLLENWANQTTVSDERLLRMALEALEIIAGERQCVDNLMGNKDVAMSVAPLLRERLEAADGER